MFRKILESNDLTQVKMKKIKKSCDMFELSIDDISECFRQQLKNPVPKEEFAERYREILESYTLVKIDTPMQYKKIAEETCFPLCEAENTFPLRIVKCCYEVIAIISGQIRLRNYSLDYVGKINEKIPIYIKIFEKQHFEMPPYLKERVIVGLSHTL